jgi:hypothetical protein
MSVFSAYGFLLMVNLRNTSCQGTEIKKLQQKYVSSVQSDSQNCEVNFGWGGSKFIFKLFFIFSLLLLLLLLLLYFPLQ